ncbi:Protein YIPF1 [Anthophora plagiata]
MDETQTKASDSQFISFQDFPSIHHEGDIGQAQLNINASSHQSFNNLTNDPTGLGIIEDLQGMPDKTEATTQHNFWTIEYYQKYFNVNTNDVVERIKRSMFPHGTENYLISHIRPNPDLYGPFWICVTLIFSIAISVNLGSYLQLSKVAGKNMTNYHWRYEFHIVSYAATCIFLYAWLLPLTLWGALKWTTSTRDTEEELIESYTTPGLLELLCVYGYSLAIYVPITFLWIIPIGWLQWSLVLIGTFVSGGILVRSLLPIISGKYRIIYIVIILGMHLLLGAGFMTAGSMFLSRVMTNALWRLDDHHTSE